MGVANDAVRDTISMRWKTDEQKEVYRQFLAICRQRDVHARVALAELMQGYVRRYARKGA